MPRFNIEGLLDWQQVINKNREALLRIVGLLFEMAGMASGDIAGKLPSTVRTSVLRLLQPAESATRRLIVIAARGLKVAPRATNIAKRDFSKLSVATSRRVPAFRLYDIRKRFDLVGRRRRRSPRALPRIHVFDGPDPLVPLFRRPSVQILEPEPKAKKELDLARLINRMKALQNALNTLPKQARRLVRSEMRRAKFPPGPMRVGPMRPGLPPGYRRRKTHNVDDILSDCHLLAQYALEPSNAKASRRLGGARQRP